MWIGMMRKISYFRYKLAIEHTNNHCIDRHRGSFLEVMPSLTVMLDFVVGVKG